MAEKCALDKLPGQCRHVEGHERSAMSGAELVKCSRHEFLSGPALSLDKNCGIREATRSISSRSSPSRGSLRASCGS